MCLATPGRKQLPWTSFDTPTLEVRIEACSLAARERYHGASKARIAITLIEARSLHERNGMTLLEVKGLTKAFGDRVIVQGLGLIVEPGEVVALLGRTGAGKTTTFHLISGRLASDSGDIWLNGEHLNRLSSRQRTALRIGHFPEELGWFRKWILGPAKELVAEIVQRLTRGKYGNGITVERFLHRTLTKLRTYPRLGRKLTSEEARRRANDALLQFGLEARRNSGVNTLSTGERRKLEIARCLLHEPRLALLDEPLTGIDPQGCQEIDLIIRRLRSEGVGVLMTDQNVRDVLRVANRTCLLTGGRVVLNTKPEDFFSDPIVIEQYLGRGFRVESVDYLPDDEVLKETTDIGQSNEPILKIVNLSKQFRRRRIVDSVNMEVEPGQMTALLGPNGAGKTTLLRAIVGVIKPTAGTVLFNGVDVTRFSVPRRCRLGIGFLPQETSVFRKLTVEQNIMAILELLPNQGDKPSRLTRWERSQRVDKLLQQFGLTHLRANLAIQLSGGERRRLELARCLASEPKLLLLDEPFTGIDPKTIADIKDLLGDLRESGLTIVVTDHHREDLLDMADNTYIIENGRMVRHGVARKSDSSTQEPRIEELQPCKMSMRADSSSVGGSPGHFDGELPMTGLLKVAGCDNTDRVGDVVFVHGLDGDAISTWSASKADTDFWPKWLGEELTNCGIWSLGYEVNSLAWKGHTMPLADRATHTLALLDAHSIGHRPVIFVAHSLGGLLVKQMLRHAIDFGEAQWKIIADRTRGVVFLSTPHSGADIASWIKYMSAALRSTVSVRELEAHDPRLRELNTWFRNNIERLGIKVQVYCEKRKVAGILVVNETSADPGIAGVVPIPMDDDHTTVCKPKSRESLLYVRVKRFIGGIMRESGS
jgi:LPS export ABC transporter ATP-binding protein